MRCALFLLIAVQCGLSAVTIDRIAVVIGNAVIKESDIDRDIRATEFLNNAPLDLGAAARKQAVNRLIEQAYIRREIRIGDYAMASWQETDQQLEELRKQRFQTPGALAAKLRQYGITEPDLRSHFLWQLTVLRFIDARFRPAVLVTDEELQTYFQSHQAALRREHPGKTSFEDLEDDIREVVTGEKVNQLFFAWLDEQKESIKVQFREEGLV
jgi:hypothetical protein